LVPSLDEFEAQDQRSKVKVTRDKKRHFFDPFGGLRAVYMYVWQNIFSLYFFFCEEKFCEVKFIIIPKGKKA